MEEGQSITRLVHSDLDIKLWLARIPTVEEVRPARCPSCGAAGRPEGARLGLWGHGLRRRQIRGPLEADGPPQIVVVQGRRYQCQRCGAVVLVAPRGVLPRRYYSSLAIGLAMALYSMAGLTLATVRQRISPWPIVGQTALGGWVTFRRWIRAVRARTLFVQMRSIPQEWTPRQAAERVATTLASLGPPTMRGHPLVERAFAGSAHAE